MSLRVRIYNIIYILAVYSIYIYIRALRNVNVKSCWSYKAPQQRITRATIELSLPFSYKNQSPSTSLSRYTEIYNISLYTYIRYKTDLFALYNVEINSIIRLFFFFLP